MKQEGIFIKHTPCPDCGSRDNLRVYEKPDGTIDGFCPTCTYEYKSPKQMAEWGHGEYKEESYKVLHKKKELADINKLPSSGDRGISSSIFELYGVKTAFSEVDGKTITHHYYPSKKNGKLTGYNEREVSSKGFKGIGDRKGSLDLFGQDLALTNGTNKLFITEGELDAMSLYQVIEKLTPAKYKTLKPSVVSVTRGSDSALKDLMNNRSFIEKYKEVILIFDQDEAGERATKSVLKTFPMLKVAKLPLKDANEMLLAGRGKELYQACMWDSEVVRQGEVLDISDFIEKALEKPKMGISFPWATVTKACFGIRPNTIHIVGAAPKIGKTDHQHQLVEHLIYKENVKVGMFDLENAPTKTAKKLAGKHDQVDYTRPDVVYKDEDLRATLLSMNNVVRFYDRSASRDWEDIRIAIEEMHLLDGINIFIIDPLTALISRYSSSEANDKLNEIMTDMSDLVMNYPITIFCYSHVNPKPKGNKPHEAGGKVYSHEFTGSRAMEKWAHYGHGISRDRTEDCEPERKNMSEFRMLFDRDFGQHYACDVYFDEKTITYLEPKRF